MQTFSRWSEQQARILRWLLLIGWSLLILSLLWPSLHLPAALVPDCPIATGGCHLHAQPGNRLFWGVVVPSGLLVIALISHELWRRICPLAFVSQLFRALERQRTRPGRNGRPEVVKVTADSWLGRHHLQLQWSLLMTGLCLRILALNSSPLGLALLLLLTLTAALVVGWAYAGKAWCQYVCPMAPVQLLLTGPRGPLGSTAHIGTSSRVTQSMCRTIATSGREQSACVACQAPCLDIDAERAYWQTIAGKRGLAWAWYSYPGLVAGFFRLMEASQPPALRANGIPADLRSGLWAHDADLPGRMLDPFAPWLPWPRLLAVPLLLVAAAWLSVGLFRVIEAMLNRHYVGLGRAESATLATSRTRLLASGLAVNIFFWFADPSQGMLGPHGAQLLRSLVLAASAVWLYRGWGRDPATYRRESTSESLRRQLRERPGLEEALDGRSLEQLSPQEVFTLAKALPALDRQQAQEIYRDVLADMLRTGRLERPQLLLQLQDLRDSLGLADQDHHEAVHLLSQDQPELLRGDRSQRQSDDLRREAVAAALEDLMATAGVEVLDPAALRPALQQRLERLRAGCGLGSEAWQDMLASYGPRGGRERQRLERQREEWLQLAGLVAVLERQAAVDSLYRPLALALAGRLASRSDWLTPRLAAAGLDPLNAAQEPAGRLEDALDLLWEDPDPDTACWVLLVERLRRPQAVQRRLSLERPLACQSPLLDDLRAGEPSRIVEELPRLADASLFADLLPEGLLWLARHGQLRDWRPAEVLMRVGEPSDGLSLVIRGEALLQTREGALVSLGPGETVGEMGVITGRPRSRTVVAGDQGVRTLELSQETFEELLRRSRQFPRALLRLLSERLGSR